MSSIDRIKLKKRGIKRFIKSFSFAIDGLKYAFIYEQNFLVHFIAIFLVIPLGIFFKIKLIEWLFVLLAIALVIFAELINTAIEAVVDLYTLKINPLAKIAKDTASAAVFILALFALIVGLIVFLPYILNLF